MPRSVRPQVRRSLAVALEALETRLPPGTLLALPFADLGLGLLGAATAQPAPPHLDYVDGSRDRHAILDSASRLLPLSSERFGGEQPSAVQPAMPKAWTAGLTPQGEPAWFDLDAQPFVTAWFGNPFDSLMVFPEAAPRLPAPRFADDRAEFEPSRSLGAGQGDSPFPATPIGADNDAPAARLSSRDDDLPTALQLIPLSARVPGSDNSGPRTTAVNCIPVAGQTTALVINTNSSSTVTSSAVLTSGQTYTLIAYGDAQIGGTAAQRGDAEFSGFSTVSTLYGSHDVGLRFNPSIPGWSNWGSVYRPDHIYRTQITGQGTQLGVYYSDVTGGYTENVGSLTVEIYEGTCQTPNFVPDCDSSDCDKQAAADLMNAAAGSCGDGSSSKPQPPAGTRALQPPPAGWFQQFFMPPYNYPLESPLPKPPRYSRAPVRYADGTVLFEDGDLSAGSFGTPWGHTRTWTNHPGYQPSGFNGSGFVVSELPYLLQGPNDALIVITNGTTERWFDHSGGNYTARHYIKDTLTAGTGEFILADTTGQVLRFHNFDASLPVWQRGTFKSLTDPHGGTHHVTAGTTWNSDGRITEVRRTGLDGATAITETWEYTYYTNDLQGLLQNVTLRRQVGTSSSIVRQADYTYYNGQEPSTQLHGNHGNLKTVVIKDELGAPLETKYYRWHRPGEANGYTGGLKYLLAGESYARMVGAGFDPLTAPNTDAGSVALFADYYFEYDVEHRVTKEVVQGLGCSCAGSGGRSTFTYTYSISAHGVGYNSWKYKTIEKQLGDTGNVLYVNTVYSNAYGQVMMTRFHADGSSTEWRDYWEYEATNAKAKGSVVLHAGPAAVTGYNEGEADLVDKDGTVYTHLSDTAGRIDKATYHPASDPTAGGFYHEAFVQRGDTTTPIKLHTQTYTRQTAGSAFVVWPLQEKVYRNTDGSGAQETNYLYTFHTGTTQLATFTATLPVVTTTQNGPGGTGDQFKVEFDTYGRPTKYIQDPATLNIQHTVQYDEPTGAVKQAVVDAGSGRLNLTTKFGLDRLGRVTKINDPNNPDGDANSRPTYVVYRDAQHEVRVYPGWYQVSATPEKYGTTGPTQVYRANWPATSGTAFYREALTMTKDPDFAGGAPTGTESIGSTLQTLARQYTNDGGQVVRADAYFHVTGLTHAATNYLGTAGSVNSDGTTSGNYWTTAYQFDERGRLQKTTAPTGTLQWVDYDVRNRPTALKVGTSDANLVTTQTFVYDGVDEEQRVQLTGGPAGGTFTLAFNGATSAPIDYNAPPTQVQEKLAALSTIGQGNVTVTTHAGGGWLVRFGNSLGGQDVPALVGDGSLLTGGTSPSVQVTTTQAGGSGVGDGNLTLTTLKPGGTGVPDRLSQFFYDWRNRPVAAKAGVQPSEHTSLQVQRPLTFTVYNNLDQPVEQEQYDGDHVTITSVNGVPARPSDATLLRARTVAEYDEQGRAFQTHVYSVDPTNGTVSANSLRTNVWYDRRGLVMKTAAPGGLVTKAAYDAAGRVSHVYQTDGRLDTSYAHAGSITDDTVLTQTEYAYDGNGNVLQTTARERFHNEDTYYGQLCGPTGELAPCSQQFPGAKSRNYYGGTWYDRVDRPTSSVNLGTNAGGLWTWTSTVPPRSNTALRTDYTYNAAGWLEDITDPRALVGRRSYDALGRVTQTIDAVGGSGRTTQYSYDGHGNTLRLKAVLPSSGEQVTRWVYGVVTGDGNDLNSNDLVKEVHHPHKTTGAADPNEKDVLTYNALGERKTFKDRLTTTHSYTYDVVGRFKSDAVTAFGAGVNDTVKRLEVSYDSAGRPQLFSSYNAATGGSVVNQVRRDYTGLGELALEYQAHTGAVDTRNTPTVGYSYSFDPLRGGANHSRPTVLTYPNGRYLYPTYTGFDDTISRLSALVDNDGRTTLEGYTYLGLGTVVKRAHPQPDVDLTYLKQTGESNGPQGDQYNGLDQFGRVVDQRWRKGDGTHTDRFGYGYDANSNRLYRENLLGGTAAAFSELYAHPTDSSGYDDLDQVVGFKRGTLNGPKTDVTEATPARRQRWTSLDIMGNWTTFDQWVGSTQTTENRTHNKQNQLTALNSTTLTYDANGNLKEDEAGRDFVYDAWNRVTQVAGTSTLNYTYDALNRRITEAVVSPALTKDLYYSSAWQVLEERHGGVVKTQYVRSPVYVDALVLRDRDLNADEDTTDAADERLYVQQDANYNVTAVVSAAGAVLERFTYDVYGLPTARHPDTWVERPISFGWQNLHQGGRFEALIGLYHFRMREYSPTLGRWTTEDPSGFAGRDSNFYRYVSNSPTGFVDNTGLAGELPQSQWPHWVKPLIGAPGGAGERGTIVQIIEVVRDMQHQGGGHFDIKYINECGKERTQRFHRGGVPFTDAENDALVNQKNQGKGRGRGGRRSRGGSIRLQGLAALLGTTAAMAGVGIATEKMVDVGWNQGMDLVTKVGLRRALQFADEMNTLPGRQFDISIAGRTYHFNIIEVRPGVNYLTAWYTQSVWIPFFGTYDEVVNFINVSDGFLVNNVNFDTYPKPALMGALFLKESSQAVTTPNIN